MRHVHTNEKLTIFLYKGFYYPVIGGSIMWENRNNKPVYEYKLGGYEGFWKFLPYVGIKCYIPDLHTKKPYREKIIKAVLAHSEMFIIKERFNDCGDNCIDGEYVLYSVQTKDKKYIGNIGSAYSKCYLEHFGGNNNISRGFYREKRKWCGWSHRAMACFGYGDALFRADEGDEHTSFIEHGYISINNQIDMQKAAKNFAEYVS